MTGDISCIANSVPLRSGFKSDGYILQKSPQMSGINSRNSLVKLSAFRS